MKDLRIKRGSATSALNVSVDGGLPQYNTFGSLHHKYNAVFILEAPKSGPLILGNPDFGSKKV